MANILIPPPALPAPPSSAGAGLSTVVKWSRDLTRVLTHSMGRITSNLNTATPLTGTWTPGISGDSGGGTKTYGTRNGRWMLQGQLVHLWGEVTVSAWSVAPTGNLRIHGLPFIHTDDEPDALFHAVFSTAVNLSTGYTAYKAYLANNSQNIRFYEVGDNVAAQVIQCSAVSPTVTILVSGAYQKRFDSVAVPGTD